MSAAQSRSDEGSQDESWRDVGLRLQRLLKEANLKGISEDQAQQFATYLQLLVRWNSKTNLTAIRDEEGILSRHFVECIACARAIPAGVAALLDFGSGAGFPGIPIAICRPEIAVTLAESQNKKAAFQREAARVLGLRIKVHGGRAEDLQERFDCATLRAVDRMEDAVAAAKGLLRPGGWLAVMTTRADDGVAGLGVGDAEWTEVALPGADRRVLMLGRVKA